MKSLKQRTIVSNANHTSGDRIPRLWKRVFTHPKQMQKQHLSTKFFEHRELTVSQTRTRLWS
jgi:hypothetical protein